MKNSKTTDEAIKNSLNKVIGNNSCNNSDVKKTMDKFFADSNASMMGGWT